jgi:hypothetical protein
VQRVDGHPLAKPNLWSSLSRKVWFPQGTGHGGYGRDVVEKPVIHKPRESSLRGGVFSPPSQPDLYRGHCVNVG